MRKTPNIYTIESLVEIVTTTRRLKKGKKWVPVRPLSVPSVSKRIRAAWLVFSGQADAVRWD